MEHYDVVIVGGGPAGISAAIWCKRLGIQHLLVEENAFLGGQLVHVHNEIIDYPGIITKNGKELQRLLVNHVEIAKCSILLGYQLASLNCDRKEIVLEQEKNKCVIHYKYLIIATGSSQRTLSVPGEREMLNRGEVYSATKDKAVFKGKRVAIIGGGDRAFEGAILLAEAGAEVFLLHRSSHYRARKTFQDKVYASATIQQIKNASVTAIQGEQKVEAITYTKNGLSYELKVDAVLLRIGVQPNTSFIRGQIEMNKEGYVLVDKLGRTNNPSVFAIGDVCNSPNYSSISVSVGQGMAAAKHISECLKTDEGEVYF